MTGRPAPGGGGRTRASFLRRAAAGVGTLLGGGLLAGAGPQLAGAARPARSGDVAALNYLLRLERLLAAFHADALAGGSLGRETRLFARVAQAQESAHVRALAASIRRLRGKIAPPPTFEFRGTTRDEVAFRQLALVLEQTVCAAYVAELQGLRAAEVRRLVSAVLPVEAQHAAWVRALEARDREPWPAPSSFSPALSREQVTAIVEGTGFVAG